MKRVMPGTKPPRVVGVYEVSQVLPDPERPALKDAKQRNVYTQSYLWSQHTALAVSDTVAAENDGHPERIGAVQVGEVAGGTVTVQVQVEGRDVFLDAERPVSGGAPQVASAPWIFTAGTPVNTIIEATSGTPTGTADVTIDTEIYTLLSKFVPIVLKGKDRMFPSKRKAARAINTNAAPSGVDYTQRLYGYTPTQTTGIAAPATLVSPVQPMTYTTSRTTRTTVPIIKPPPK